MGCKLRLTCDGDCEHPPRSYYEGLGLQQYQIDYIIAGFHAPDDYPTQEEWLQMSEDEKLKWQ